MLLDHLLQDGVGLRQVRNGVGDAQLQGHYRMIPAEAGLRPRVLRIAVQRLGKILLRLLQRRQPRCRRVEHRGIAFVDQLVHIRIRFPGSPLAFSPYHLNLELAAQAIGNLGLNCARVSAGALEAAGPHVQPAFRVGKLDVYPQMASCACTLPLSR